MTMQMWIVAGIAIFFMAIMLTGKVSLLKGALTVLCLLILTKSLTVAEAMAGFTQTSILCIAAMLPIASNLGRTKLVAGIKNKIIETSARGGKDIVVITLMFVSAAVLAQLIPSQTAIIAVLMSFLAALGTDSEITMNRILIPITWVLTMWLGRLPLAVGATSYMVVNAQLDAAGLSQYALTITDTMKMTLIPTIVCTVYAIFTYKMLPKTPTIAVTGGGIQSQQGSGRADELLPEKSQNMLYAAFVISILALCFAGKLGEIAYAIPFACLLVLVWLGALDGRQCLVIIGTGSVFAVGGLFALVNAITKSGVGAVVGNGIMRLMGENPGNIKILVVFAIATSILTSFTNNSVAIPLMQTLAFAVCSTAGMDPRGIIGVIMLAGLSSVITPMASNSCAIAYSTSGLTVRDTWKWSIPGTVICIIGAVINSLIVYLPLG